MKAPADAYVAQLTKGANTKGVGNQKLAPKVLADGTKEFDLTASVIDWEVSPGKTVKAWAYNGRFPGPWIKVDVGDKVRVVLDNELPQSTVDPLPRHRGAERDGRRSRRHAAAGQAGRDVHVRVRRQGPGGRHVPLARLRRAPGARRPGSACSRSATCRCPPAPVRSTQEVPMVLNDAGVIGLSLNGKSFPATAPVMAQGRRVGRDHVLQRGPADPPDAPARHPAARHRQGRVPAAARRTRPTPSRRAG